MRPPRATARRVRRDARLVVVMFAALLGTVAAASAAEFPPGFEQAVRAQAAPPSKLNPAIDPKKGYAVESLGDGAYFVTDGLYQAMFVVTRKGVVLVDAPPTLGTKLPKAIAEKTRRPVRYFIYSHEHADHTGSAHLFATTSQFIGQQQTAARLRADHDPKRPVPTRTFGRRLALDIGGQRIDLVYPGSNHEPGNIFIWLPRQRILMAVDVVFAGHVPFKALGESEDIPGWVRAHDRILNYPFRFLVGGHFGLSTRQNVIDQRRYVEDVRHFAGVGLTSVDVQALVQQIGTSRPWKLFKAYLDAATGFCADRTLARWQGRLLEADVFTDSNCEVMVNTVRIRDGDLGPFGDGTPVG